MEEAMARRRKIPESVAGAILSKSRRRCCVCAHLRRDFTEKKGQIAHVNHDPSDNSEDNLVFLCLEHHDEYDSRTSVSKGLTKAEILRHRELLYARNEQTTSGTVPAAMCSPENASLPTMLIAEDQDADAIVTFFKSRFAVSVVRNGREAMKLLDRGHRYDICLIDLRMPVESVERSFNDWYDTGVRVIRRILENGYSSRFLVLTGRYDSEAVLTEVFPKHVYWKLLVKNETSIQEILASVEDLMARSTGT